MRVSIIKKNKINNIILPTKIEGNYWISDIDKNGIKRNLMSIESVNGNWQLKSNKDVICLDNNGNTIANEILEENKFYTIKNIIENRYYLIYCSHIQSKFTYYNISNYVGNGLSFGKNRNNDIYSNIFDDTDYFIKDINGSLYISDNNSKYGVYVNNIRINKSKKLKNGDIIFILGMKLVFLYFNNNNNIIYYLGIDENIKEISVKCPQVENLPRIQNNIFNETNEELEYPMYDESEYYHKVPRFTKQPVTLELNIDAPPEKKDDNNSSLILTIGPMITMSMTSLVMGYVSINSVANGESTWAKTVPSLIICGAMFASVFVWPIFSRRYEKKLRKIYEDNRQEKYRAYVETKKMAIVKARDEQSALLRNNYPTVEECLNIILSKLTPLWQRRIGDDNFLETNLGLGSSEMKINIRYPEDHFTMIEDNLKEMVLQLENEPKVLPSVPIVYSFYRNYLTSIVGNDNTIHEYAKQLLIQILAHHSYDDLKIVILTDEEKEYNWKFAKCLPHLFTNEKSLRYYAVNNDEYKEICYHLNDIYESRKEKKEEEPNEIYLIITDNYKRIRNFDIIDSIINSKENYGFSLLVLDEKITELPDECESIIKVGSGDAELIDNKDISNNIKYIYNDKLYIDYEKASKVLANIPVEFKKYAESKMPAKLGFLEMYDVGKIEQLNTLVRWQNSDPITNLSTEVGYDSNGEKIFIDLHEKYHGPHGLIAGMTGSGKSEFIITYILSMAINYHPYEVQFILIDYKGGGLAGAFENNATGLKLPHLIGTITNLDTNEINRSLASIESELKKRQILFNEAREKSDDTTIDIYKYQKMYRDKLVEEPISHLFIICDEFAELKQQQPEFMEQLISIARIGRSLGVHLILATQKPSGVVDPQIWSNTRFRVCLRVQDKGDSNEVIKCNDAAFLKQTGRFYFQVGFNEIFILGQAAWSGGKYIPKEKVNKTIDTAIDYINNVGYSTRRVDTKEKVTVKTEESSGELLSIVKYLSNIAKEENIICKPLWLQRIPNFIKIENLINKYKFQPEECTINPIIGEYDIPNEQKQQLLTLPLTKMGNTLIYGSNSAEVENFIITTIYSSLLFYTPNDINYYIVDLGSEALRIFNECPIVGDILNGDNDDLIENLYKMLLTTIEERKKLFSDYNGDYVTYCKTSGNKVPNIVVVINNYELYQETYEKFDDILTSLSRECTRYGIFFILTVNTPNGVRFKLKQNFALIYALQQNNNDDYSAILGNVYKIYPSKLFGRGIIKNDTSVFEFQTAVANELENIPKYIKQVCTAYASKYPYRSKRIPELPEVVRLNKIVNDDPESLVIGLKKSDLNPCTFNFKHNFITLLTALDIYAINDFINAFIKQIKDDLLIINTEEFKLNHEAITSDFDNVIERLNNITKQTYCIIIGPSTFINKLSLENKNKLDEIFNNLKTKKTVSFIIVDSIDKVKKMEIEQWYKNNVKSNNGIWFGNGILDQFSLRFVQKIEEMKLQVPENYCFVIKNGIIEYVKIIED